MALTHEEMTIIKNEIINDCKQIFVLSDDCDEIQRSTARKFANDDKRIERLMDRMNIWNKLLWTIATTSVGALVTSFLQLILK